MGLAHVENGSALQYVLNRAFLNYMYGCSQISMSMCSSTQELKHLQHKNKEKNTERNLSSVTQAQFKCPPLQTDFDVPSQ